MEQTWDMGTRMNEDGYVPAQKGKQDEKGIVRFFKNVYLRSEEQPFLADIKRKILVRIYLHPKILAL